MNKSFITPDAPPPDKGLISAIGKTSPGIPILLVIGDNAFVIKSSAPDALNTPIATNIPTKNGIIDTDDGAISKWTDAHCVTAIKLDGTENYSSGPISSFVLNGGKIKGTAYGISGNGSRGGTEIRINGGVVDSYHSGAAIYNPQMGTVTVTGGEIISTVGIEMRSGTLNVTGGTVTARAEYKLTINGASASGASYSDGVIIGVSQHTTNNPLNINISGGTFNIVNNGYDGSATYYALYEEDYQDEESDNITMSITGGIFTGKINSENCQGFITGGTFSDPSAFVYLGNNANVTVGADMNIVKAITIPTGITATINLNGFDVTAPNTDAFEVAGTLTINGTDESAVSAGTENPNASVCAVWANGGTVTINGGHYKVYSDANGKRNDCIYAGYNADNNDTAGKITINGGKFEYVWPTTKNSGTDYNGDMFLLNCADKDLDETLITVNGGQFKNNVPSYEPTTPNTRQESEVQLGDGKKVYNGEIEVKAAHNGTADVWYEVK